MIFPVPVTLKRFLALEFVFTLGILPSINNYTLEVFLHRQNPYWTSSANTYPVQNRVLEELPFFQTECKDKAGKPSGKGISKEKGKILNEPSLYTDILFNES